MEKRICVNTYTERMSDLTGSAMWCNDVIEGQRSLEWIQKEACLHLLTESKAG